MSSDKPSLSSLRGLALPIGLVVLLAGCGGGADAPADGPIEAAPAKSLAVNSTGGCSVDRDCAEGNYCFLGQCASACQSDADCSGERMCTERGRCLKSGEALGVGGNSGTDPAVSEATAWEGLRVVKPAGTQFRIGEDQKSVTYQLELNEPTPKGGLPYRIDRSDDDEVTKKVNYIESNGTTLSFEIPVGQASPKADDSKRVQLKLFTPLGNYTLDLLPRFPVSGSYQGTATFKTFGQSGLDISFQVVTKPDGVSLRQAETAWLVLPVGKQHLLSPLNPAPTSPTYVARELTFGDLRDNWVATFGGRYDLSDGEIVRVANPDQVSRELRFQLERIDEDTLVGHVTDHWSGLYEPKSARDVEAPPPVSFEGEIAVDRAGPARSHAELKVEALPQVDSDDQTPPAPPVDRCSESKHFDVTPVERANQPSYSCQNIDNVEQFKEADPAAQASCAMAVSRHSMTGETTISRVETYLTGQNSGMDSFSEFMQKCAAHENGLCEPTTGLRCGRQLVARAYDSQGPDSAELPTLVDQYNQATRETFFGQQVAAFYSDTALREEWLNSTNWPRTFQGLKNLVGSMLEDWKTKVLEAHIGSLKGQFDTSGLNVLSRQVDEADAADARTQLLIGMTQSWRGSIDALTLATKRWNLLYQSAGKRQQKADYVAGRILDLYLAAGLLSDLNESADNKYLNARLAGGFDVLVDQLDRLSQPFSDLIYARDGEVTISRSLDPKVDNETLLSRRRKEAIDQIDSARTNIKSILEESRAQALQEEELKSKWAKRIDDARTNLVEMCGRPVGCQEVNYLEGAPPEGCEVRWQAGRCGFKVDRQSGKPVGAEAGQQNTSEAGGVVLEIAEAIKNVHIAEAERESLSKRISLRYAELEAFATDIEERNELRRQQVRRLKKNVQQRQSIRNQAVDEILTSMQESADLHQKVIDESARRFERWGDMESNNTNEVMAKVVEAENQRIAARSLGYAADTARGLGEVAAALVPDSTTDFATTAEAGAKLAGVTYGHALDTAAFGLEESASRIDLARQRLENRQSTEMTEVKRQLKLDKAKWSRDIAELRRERQAKKQLTNNQVAQLKETIEIARRYLEADLAHRRDLAKFRAKRTKVKEMLTEVAGLDLRYQRANLQLTQTFERYRRVVQQARNTHAQLEKLTSQGESINNLIGSPEVIFTKANELKAAERNLFAARRTLMDWLVALEYYAVRPFLDQRMQILLARNAYQLQEIARELKTLQANCGGPTSRIDTVLSVRQDLLGITQPSTDAVTDRTFSPAQQFREVLNRGYVPVDKRIRYRSNETVGDLMARSPDIMAGTFFVDLEDFANLPVSCNARVESVAVNLVGEGLAEVRPNVTILYDGTSQLRTCQPGLAEHIDQVSAQGATVYDTISRFTPQGRGMAPVATVNGFGPEGGQTNETLSGLPLSSQYTLLINKTVGENAQIDWNKLKDIELKLQYTYQDFFPENQCQL